MPFRFLFLLACSWIFFLDGFGQGDVPLVRAETDETYFLEGDVDSKNDWWLDTELALDVYETSKSSGPMVIRYYTDVDSLEMRLGPGEHFDFNVLLAGKDTCKQRVEVPAIITRYADQFPSSHDTIPFTLTSGNNIKVQCILNRVDTVDLFFDTGATELVMTHGAIRDRTQLLAGMPEGYQTRTYHPLPMQNSLQIGETTWEGITVYPVSLTGQETDGHFGWNLFDGRLVEVNYDRMEMVIHSSLADIPEGYVALEMEFMHTLFCVPGRLLTQGKAYANRFLFDTGYQRQLLLDRDLVKEQSFPKDLTLIRIDTLRNGTGKIFETRVVNLDSLDLGGAIVENTSTEMLDMENPARFKVHFLGNQLLRKFNLILDFYDNIVYMKRNEVEFGVAEKRGG